MEIRVLGPLEIVDDGRVVALGSGRQTRLLHCLLLHRNEVVSRDRLIDALWGERPPASAPNALQVQVHALRKALGQDRIATEGAGYRLRADPDEVDVERFERLVARGRCQQADGESEKAAETLREALALWRGPALADVVYEPFAQSESARLEELRTVALEERIDADLALARHHDLVPELEALVPAHPARERLHAHLMLALYRSGRQAEALETFRRARRALRDELGLEPGPELQELQQAILRQDAVLRIEAPELRARRHLPAPATTLVGRRAELAELARLVRSGTARLVTLTGAGGIGKTRLALQVAHDLADAFADGVFFVDLAHLRDHGLVPSAIARAVGVEEQPSELLDTTILTSLRGKRLLLLLDNFETVADGASLIGELLRTAENSSVLVTSRAPLRLSGEHEYRLQPLPLGDAVALFTARARAVAPSFRLASEEAAEVEQLCARLDGLPLAIELAAARTRDYHPAELLEMAPGALELATEGARDLPARHRTLRAAIDWSHELLPEAERGSFARLAIFAGGCTAAAAAAVCDTGRGVLASLVATSLLQERLSRARGEPRWFLLETVREFALEQLDERGELADLARRHAEHFALLAEDAEEQERSAVAWATLDEEVDNLRAALSWAHATGEVELELRLVGALAYYWSVRDHLREGMAAIEAALERSEGAPAALRGKALGGGSRLAQSLGEYGTAQAFAEASLAAYDSVGDRHGMARALLAIGVAAGSLGDRARSRALYEESAEIYRALGQERGLAVALNNLAYEVLQSGEYERARTLCTEALAILERLGTRARMVLPLGNLGHVDLLEQRADDALDTFARAVDIARATGYVEGAIYALEGTAAALAALGLHQQAATILGAARAAAERTGVELEPFEARVRQEALETVHEALGEDEATELVAAGGGLPLEDALVYALRETRAALAPHERA
jgi:predicted ATPase/DNA-binding SARP family transcriptional activator